MNNLLKISGGVLAGILITASVYSSQKTDILSGIEQLKDTAISYKEDSLYKQGEILKLMDIISELEKQANDLKNQSNVDKAKIEDLENQIENLKGELAKAQADAEYFEGEFKYVLNEYWNELDNSAALYSELNKANAEIEKANKEQLEILDAINNAIKEVELTQGVKPQ